MWRMARDSRVLDLNASYAYLLWCRDFAGTSIVATVDGRQVGFVTGYLRPEHPDVLMVWQVAVDAEHRGRGLAGRMLHELADRGAALTREPVFEAGQFPDAHQTELLFRIGRIRPARTGGDHEEGS